MQKVLVICGPTASGKTDLALTLAKKFNGEIISADSRQVYRGMDIGTGKDLPKNSKFEGGSYQIAGISLWGYDLISPKEEFSVAQFVAYAKKVIAEIHQRGKLPIVVGGTGLYIRGLIDGIETASIPRNEELRRNLVGRSTNELFEPLAQLDPIKAASLNTSDKKNPRRLVRAIEISQWRLSRGQVRRPSQKFDSLFVGLSAPKEILFERIDARVNARIKRDFLKEVKGLLDKGIDWEYQAMSSLGYRQLRDYFEGRLNLNEAFARWAKEEKKYTKRQLTWWKHDKRVNWFDITKVGWQKKVENLVKKWYSTSNVKKS